jgi:uncharacterized protein (DUF849 family)
VLESGSVSEGEAMNKLIINVRLNEWEMRGPNTNIPYSPSEIATDAALCREAGASIVHVHARQADGGKSHDPAVYVEITEKIRASSDVLIHTTLGNVYNEGDAGARTAHVDAARPDIATVDIGSTNMDVYNPAGKKWKTTDKCYVNSIADCLFFANRMKKIGVKPSLGIWTIAFMRTADAFIDMGVLEAPALAKIALCGGGRIAGHEATPAGLSAYFHAIPPDGRIQWAVCTKHANVFPCAAVAIANGGHVAPGLGDYHYPELGYPTNAELVRHIVRMAQAMGREVATPEDAKQILHMN